MDILTSFVVMFSIALLAGVVLAVFSRVFAVAENPLKKKVRECLPGINCGACGFKSCDDYAEALAEGKAAPNMCVPGAQSVAETVAAVIGVEAEPVKDVVAFVACNGTCDAVTNKAKYDGVDTCKAAGMLYGGDKYCYFSCLGYGDCAKVCPANAICLKDGIARVLTDRCLGCGLCEDVCPKKIITMVAQDTRTVVMCSNKQKVNEAIKACKNACIGCKKCEKTCLDGAIAVENNLAKIDYTKCTNCGKCVEACPTGCLKSVVFPDLKKGE